jgi:hypothetical protein
LNVTISPSRGTAPVSLLIFAVNVTGCPYADGFNPDESATVVVLAYWATGAVEITSMACGALGPEIGDSLSVSNEFSAARKAEMRPGLAT